MIDKPDLSRLMSALNIQDDGQTPPHILFEVCLEVIGGCSLTRGRAGEVQEALDRHLARTGKLVSMPIPGMMKETYGAQTFPINPIPWTYYP